MKYTEEQKLVIRENLKAAFAENGRILSQDELNRGMFTMLKNSNDKLPKANIITINGG